MNIAYFTPHLNTIYAGRTIAKGYENAFTDLKHEFRYITANDNQKDVFQSFRPKILLIGLNNYTLKYVNLDAVNTQRKAGMKVFVNIPFWKSPFSKLRINEAQSISDNIEWQRLITSNRFGDAYYNACEHDDERMKGFEMETGYKHFTIPLAADRRTIYPEYSQKYLGDISYIGTNLPGKRNFFNEYVYPLRQNYTLHLYGQDWTMKDRLIGNLSRVGRYFNLPLLRSIQKPKLDIGDERKIYTSSLVSINIHEDYQREYGGDCNERTFKIPLARGFEITDDVSCISKYFVENEEIIIAHNRDDWFDKIDYYIRHKSKRTKIIQSGQKKVLLAHTYHHRAEQMLKIYEKL